MPVFVAADVSGMYVDRGSEWSSIEGSGTGFKKRRTMKHTEDEHAQRCGGMCGEKHGVID